MSSNSTKFRKGNPFKFHHKTRESKLASQQTRLFLMSLGSMPGRLTVISGMTWSRPSGYQRPPASMDRATDTVQWRHATSRCGSVRVSSDGYVLTTTTTIHVVVVAIVVVVTAPAQCRHAISDGYVLTTTTTIHVVVVAIVVVVTAQCRHTTSRCGSVSGSSDGYILTTTILVVKKAAHTRLPSVGFWSWSRFLAVSLQVMWVINPMVGCHYFPPSLQLPPQPLRGLLPILLLGEERHNGCEQFA